MVKKGAMVRMPRETAGERLSPGVYRGSRGGLVGQGGQQIRRQPQAPSPVAPPQNNPMQIDPGAFNPGMQMPNGQQVQQGIYLAPGFGADQTNMPMDKMYRWPQGPQMPQPSANMGGQYRLSPGVYGTQQQAMDQYNQQMQQMGFQNAAQGVSNMPYRPIAMPQVPKR